MKTVKHHTRVGISALLVNHQAMPSGNKCNGVDVVDQNGTHVGFEATRVFKKGQARPPLIAVAPLLGIGTAVADGVVRLNSHGTSAPLADLGDVGALRLTVEGNHLGTILRVIAHVPVAIVVIIVVTHCADRLQD